jgi:hypothetical protein
LPLPLKEWTQQTLHISSSSQNYCEFEISNQGWVENISHCSMKAKEEEALVLNSHSIQNSHHHAYLMSLCKVQVWPDRDPLLLVILGPEILEHKIDEFSQHFLMCKFFCMLRQSMCSDLRTKHWPCRD